MADGPKPRRVKKSPGKDTIQYGNFINHSLSVADEEWLDKADLDSEYPLYFIDQLVMQGYKFSLGYDEKNQCAIASLTNRVPGTPLAGYTLSGRGPTPLDAWFSLCYRHYHLAREDWSYFANQSERPPKRFS